MNKHKEFEEYMDFITKIICETMKVPEKVLNKKYELKNLKVSKRKYPRGLKKLKIKIFNKLGKKWYHYIIPHKILKFFGKEFVLWTYCIETKTIKRKK